MARKSSQLQIRVSPRQKAVLKRLAAEAGMSVSGYVLSTVLPDEQLEFARRVESLHGSEDRAAARSDLAEFLEALETDVFLDATAGVDLSDLPGVLANYVAASVEREAHRRGVHPPEWTVEVPSLERPNFEWDLPSLRPHLMRLTPPAFKRRRLFAAWPTDVRR